MPATSNKSGGSFFAYVILLGGILSISFSWLYGFPGLALGFLTLHYIKKSGGGKKKSADGGFGIVLTAKIFAITGVIISSIFVLLLLFKWFISILSN